MKNRMLSLRRCNNLLHFKYQLIDSVKIVATKIDVSSISYTNRDEQLYERSVILEIFKP